MRAVPRLIAERSPLFEARGKRHWTLWIVPALDPAATHERRFADVCEHLGFEHVASRPAAPCRSPDDESPSWETMCVVTQ
jgi:hypothetical protein